MLPSPFLPHSCVPRGPPTAYNLIVGFDVSQERMREESIIKILPSLDGAVEATAGCPSHTQLYNNNDKGIPEPGIPHPSPLGVASLYSSSPKPPISTEECTPIGKTLEGIASSDCSFIYGVRADESKIIIGISVARSRSKTWCGRDQRERRLGGGKIGERSQIVCKST